MDIGNRVIMNNVPTYGTMHDQKIKKKAFQWITSTPNIPEDAWFFLTFTTNAEGGTVTCMVMIVVGGVNLGSYDVLGETTCEQVLINFNYL